METNIKVGSIFVYSGTLSFYVFLLEVTYKYDKNMLVEEMKMSEWVSPDHFDIEDTYNYKYN